MGSQRDQDRLTQGGAAVLSVRRAAELLPIGDAAGRAWLRREGLVRRLEGADVVVWADVLDRVRSGALFEATDGVGCRRPLADAPRTRLD